MKIHWLYLLLGLALLLPPIPFPANIRRTLRRRNAANLGAAVRLWQNWADLARAAFGVYVLMELAIVVDSSSSPGAEFSALALKAAVLGLVLLAQTIRMFHNVQFLAPVFYLCGLTLMLGGWQSWGGAFAVGVGWLFAVGGQNLSYQLPAMAVASAVAGYVLGPTLPLMLNCALILIPLILSLLFKKRLLFASISAEA
jgi:hypothetical protein